MLFINHCEHCAGPNLSLYCVATPKIEKQTKKINKLIFFDVRIQIILKLHFYYACSAWYPKSKKEIKIKNSNYSNLVHVFLFTVR